MKKKDLGFSDTDTWKKCFNSDYLGVVDLPDRKDIVLTIVGVTREEVGGGNGSQKQNRPIIHFAEKFKPMICNATNSAVISTLANSTFPNKWVGTKVQIYVQSGIKAFGTISDGLRIKEYVPKPVQKKVLDANDTANFDKVIAYIKAGHTVDEVCNLYAVSGATKKILIEKTTKQDGTVTK